MERTIYRNKLTTDKIPTKEETHANATRHPARSDCGRSHHAPDAAIRKKILVDNPAKLYAF
jgi:hypothetical protein